MNQRKILLQPKGPDGRPLLFIRVARHFATTTIECEAFVTYCLEAASKMCDALPVGDGKLWAFFDLQGVKLANMDRHALSSCFSILEREFPERIHKIFMFDAPFIFEALWRIVSPFVDPHTRQKVAFVSGLDPFLAVVDKSIIPRAYGGVAEEVPVEVAVRSMNASVENGGSSGKVTAGGEEKEGPAVVAVVS
jgi:CRAL/TRIO domain